MRWYERIGNQGRHIEPNQHLRYCQECLPQALCRRNQLPIHAAEQEILQRRLDHR